MPHSEPEVNATTIRLDEESLRALAVQALAVYKEVCGADKGREALGDMPSAWIYQRPEQVRQLGEKGAPWYCGWIDPDKRPRSKSCGKGPEGKRLANRLKRKVEAELLLGTYETNADKAWAEFRDEYERTVVPGLALKTQDAILAALDTFQRIANPGRMVGIKTATVDAFRAARRKEPSRRRPGELVSPATLNKELRHLRAALKKAWKWKYLPEMPDFDFEREPKHLPAFLEPECFAKLYQACAEATKPAGQPYPPADWWRGLLTTLMLTGWRVGAVLELQRADVDFERGTALTRAEDTKGKRDQRVPVHPVVLDHWRRLPGFSPELFPWPYHPRTLWVAFHKLREAAGVPRLAFHSIKKAFCTLNAPLIDPSALGFLAQHQSRTTTDKHYINPAAKIQEAVSRLFVPDVLKTGTGG